MSRRRIALIVALLLTAVPVGAALWLLHSEAALEWLLVRLGQLPSVRIEATGATGTLAGPIAIERLVVDHEAVRVEVRDLRLDARLASLFAGIVHLERASAAGLEVVLKAREEQPPERPYFLPRFLEVSAPELQVAGVALTLAGGERIGVATVRGALAVTRWRVAVDDLGSRTASTRTSRRSWGAPPPAPRRGSRSWTRTTTGRSGARTWPRRSRSAAPCWPPAVWSST